MFQHDYFHCFSLVNLDKLLIGLCYPRNMLQHVWSDHPIAWGMARNWANYNGALVREMSPKSPLKFNRMFQGFLA